MHAETDVDWMAKGLCADMDPDIFFPDDGMGVLAAQEVCRKCPVKEQCLDYALNTRQEHGIWGGVSERERRRIRRRRRQD